MHLEDIRRLGGRVLSFYTSVLQAVAAVLLVSAVLVLPAYLLGPVDMDITFDIQEPSAHAGARDGTAVHGWNKDKGIECSDASAAIGDGRWWIRCRFVAEKVSYATDHLRANGLEPGGTYTRVVMQPPGGGWINMACAALLTLVLGGLWLRQDRSRLGHERAWIAGHKPGSALALIAPAGVTFLLITLGTWLPGGAQAQPPPPLGREYLLTMFLTVVLCAPIVEELLYRGVIHDLMCRRTTPLLAACVGTVLFVAAHIGTEFWKVDPIRVAALTVGSLTLYAVRIRTGSLLLCIGGHVLLNLIVVLAYSLQATN